MKSKLWNKRIIGFALALLLGLNTFLPADAAEAEDTIYIDSAEDLLELADRCTLDTWSQGKTVILQSDISLENVTFQPIPTFGGILEGNGHTISGLYIEGSVTPAGFFSYLQETAVVKDLTISGRIVPDGDGRIAGGIVGENSGTLINCSFAGTVSSVENTGGIAGINTFSGVLLNCRTSGAILGEHRTGGIAGYNMGVINTCQNNAYVNITSVDPTLKLEDVNVDALLGMSSMTALNVSEAASDTGGIAGYSAGIILDCINENTIGYQHIGYNVGGIVGRSSGYIANCENLAKVYGRKDVGGIVGQVEPYIEIKFSESTLSKLTNQLEELNHMVAQVQNSADAKTSAVNKRLDSIADYVDSAAEAAKNITATGSVNSQATGSGGANIGGSINVTPPQVEKDGSITVTPPSVSEPGKKAASLEGELRGGLTEGSIEKENSASADGSFIENTQITVNTSLNGLAAAVNGMTGQMRLLNDEAASTAKELSADLKAIQNQISAISDTVSDAMFNTENEAIVQDTSEVDMETVTYGKVAACQNSGSVYGDISVGGITGAMAIEYEADPEDDVTENLTGEEKRTYELKAILQNCINTGEVTAKRSYAGGICGRMNLGYIIGGENYGDVKSENGDYVGGIAGLAGSTVQSSYVKCTLKGHSYIGGIIGSGTEDSYGEATSLVAGCYSLVDIPEYEQYVGAVSGTNIGIYTENYFVSDRLAGINRLSYTGMAEPVTFQELGEVPEKLKQFSLCFVAEEEILKVITFSYGDSFEETVFPELPVKEGYAADWDKTKLQNLHFDTTVMAVYTPYVSVLASEEVRSTGRPVFLAEGLFEDQTFLAAKSLPVSSEQFQDTAKNWQAALKKCFTSGSITGETVEQWKLTFPEDGLLTHTVRYLAEDADTENLDIYVKQKDVWEKMETEAVGSYLTFETEENDVEVAVISTIPIWKVWLRTLFVGSNVK